MYLNNIFIIYSGMLFKVYIQCLRHTKTRATPHKITKDYVQQSRAYLQQVHRSKSVKGRSCVASKKCIADDFGVNPT